MYNQTPFGVRRAHSFDSYDNLERWQAIREHRKQFLSTRAKFDKTPPSEPPPPPPRHASKFKVIPSPSSSAVSQLIQNFNKEMKNKNSIDKSNSYSIFQKKTEDQQYELETRNIVVPTNKTHTSSGNNSSKINRFQDHEQGVFRALESPGNVLKITQSWQKYQTDPDETYYQKTSFQSVPLPVVTQEKKQQLKVVNEPPVTRERIDDIGYRSIPLPVVTQKRKQQLQVVNEPPVTRERIDEIGYQQPTYFKEINISTTIPHTSTNYETHSGIHVPSRLHLDSVSASKEQEIEILSVKRTTGSKQAGYTSKEQNMYIQGYIDSSGSKNDIHQRTPSYKVNGKPKYNTQENRRIYLESTLNMFTDDLLGQENSDYSDNSSVYSSDRYFVKPRRVSTGSMHEPTNWRSQPPLNPVKAVVQNYSNSDFKNNN